MPFSNKRNSRDDKSGKSGPSSFPKRRSGGDRNFDDRKKKFGESWNDRNREERSQGARNPSAPESRDNRERVDRNDKKPYSIFNRNDQNDQRSGYKSAKSGEDRPKRSGSYEDNKKPYGSDRSSDRKYHKDGAKPVFKNKFERGPSDRNHNARTYGDRPRTRNDHGENRRYEAEPKDDGLIRLNRYIANAGVCSRRKADELIGAGVVSVNGQVVTELGTRVDPSTDEIRYNGERLKREKMVYVLLNKPKDYITTTDDPQERRTVMHLVEKASSERIYPVGRLDRNTTGLILLTNDGNLAEKLSHPKHNISKIYQVELDKGLIQGDFNKLEFGLQLEDGFVKPDDISYVQGASKKEVGIKIHNGKNRIVRRMFEFLGYNVVKLDRVVYGSLTKKDLPRGRWRYLEEREIIQLKHFIK